MKHREIIILEINRSGTRNPSTATMVDCFRDDNPYPQLLVRMLVVRWVPQSVVLSVVLLVVPSVQRWVVEWVVELAAGLVVVSADH